MYNWTVRDSSRSNCLDAIHCCAVLPFKPFPSAAVVNIRDKEVLSRAKLHVVEAMSLVS